jgi:hypothetical protein
VANVVEVHQETVEISYTKQGATRQVSPSSGQSLVWLSGGSAIPADELVWQVEQQLKQIARDVELAFLTGVYNQPTDNTAPRKTRGLLSAITTNVVASEALTKEAVLDLMQEVWTSGGIRETETRTLIVNAPLKRALTKAFITDANYQEQTRNVGGVNLQTVETDFGRVNIMLNGFMPVDTLAVVSLEQCSPVFLEIPGRGHFFAEPLGKDGASERVQIYGEIGFRYGNEKAHGKLVVTPEGE